MSIQSPEFNQSSSHVQGCCLARKLHPPSLTSPQSAAVWPPTAAIYLTRRDLRVRGRLACYASTCRRVSFSTCRAELT